MESVGVFQNEDCDFMNKMLLINEEADSAFQFLPGFGTSSDLWPCTAEANANANIAFFDENFDTSFCFSQENTNISTYGNSYTACFPSQETPQFCDANIVMSDIPQSMDFCVMDGPNNTLPQFFLSDHVMHDVVNLKVEMGNAQSTDLGIKRKFEVPQQAEAVVDVENRKKKRRVPRDIPTCKKNVQAKKNKSVTEIANIDEDSTYNGPVAQSSSSYSSEDDSSTSQELNGGATLDSKGSEALNSSKKPRAGRGAATDPQSLYARKRREKINERLRILQNLVPNGTKVDISTMLEDAVHYVQFLQLQIKLLSSDEMWMYAPIAHKGMDMGLYQNIFPPQ